MLSTGLKTTAKSALLKPARFVNNEFDYIGRMEFACSRGALGAAVRSVDPLKAWTWEFSAFSQNGEDGIIDHLLSLIDAPTRYFVEIGGADGLENNSAYLAFVKGYSGMMIEGNEFYSGKAREFLQRFNWSVEFINTYVTPENAKGLAGRALTVNPDLFSLDIDSNDYWVAVACLEAGFRPSVLIAEYNSTFGPDDAVTIPYSPDFDVDAYPGRLYYGASLTAWKKLFGSYGYRFVTVDQRGINAFFVSDGVRLPADVQGIEFAENQTQLMRNDGGGWQSQLERIAHLPTVDV